MRQETSKLAFAGLAEGVGAGVPEHIPTFLAVERDERDRAVAFQGSVEIPQFSVNLRDDNVGAHFLGYVAQK